MISIGKRRGEFTALGEGEAISPRREKSREREALSRRCGRFSRPLKRARFCSRKNKRSEGAPRRQSRAKALRNQITSPRQRFFSKRDRIYSRGTSKPISLQDPEQKHALARREANANRHRINFLNPLRKKDLGVKRMSEKHQRVRKSLRTVSSRVIN